MTTPTNDRQTSERERLAGIINRIVFAGAMRMRDADMNELEKIAAQLRADEAELAQARAAYERAENDVQILTREIAALRAENEALRTVTDEDVIRTSARTGVMPVDVRKALQSFIRSKESRRD